MDASSSTAFRCVGGLSFDDANFLLVTIWESRRHFIPLVNRGMLPGLSALLLTLYRMYQVELLPSAPSSNKYWIQLQDVLFRFLLVGTGYERQQLVPFFNFVLTEMRVPRISAATQTDKTDVRAIVRAYANLFRYSRSNVESPASAVDIATSLLLFRNVYHYVVSHKPVRYLPEAAWAGLERLWMELDTEYNDTITSAQCSLIVLSATIIYQAIGQMDWELRMLGNKEEFEDMLLDVDIFDLSGRIILLAIGKELGRPSRRNGLPKNQHKVAAKRKYQAWHLKHGNLAEDPRPPDDVLSSDNTEQCVENPYR
ncbi:hypothetical protein FRC08_004434 [Ceratobasidium sp. 394]|nr:hypothetical protein FRC08_004434 [Ceratobasidium sp. 394]